MELSPSLLGADLMHLADEIHKVESLGIKWLHLDHMDGVFVPNISFGPDFVAAIRKETSLFLDVHLMLDHPLAYIDRYAEAGSDLIVVHVEAADDPVEALNKIRAKGIKAGISIRPGTPPEVIEEVLPLVDVVLVMTVEPGFGGQSLRDDCVAKIPALRDMIKKCGRDILIEVDGGVKASNAGKVLAAGADVLVMGTGLFRAEDPQAVVDEVNAVAKQCAL